MEVIFILLPLAIAIAGVMLALFIWAVRSGQYDDLETPAHRILFDEEKRSPRRRAPEQEDPTSAEPAKKKSGPSDS